MKILYYSEDIPGEHTGFGNQGEFLVDHWVRSGHEVTCIAPIKQGRPQIMRAFGALVLPGNPADVVNFVDIMGLGPDDKIIFLTETWILQEYRQALEPILPRMIAIAVIDGHPLGQRDRALWKSIGTVVTISRFAYRELPKSVYIPHGVNTDFFTPMPPEERWALRERCGLTPHDFVVGHVASNQSLKGTCTAIKAVGLLKKEIGPEIKMLLKTEMTLPLYEWAKMCGTELITWTTDVMTNIRRFYSIMDVHVLPSQGEAFGLVMAESQACGVPNVATDYSGCKELIESYGALIPVTLWQPCPDCNLPRAFVTAEDTAVAIDHLRLLPDNKKAINKRKTVEAMQQYSWKNVLAAWDALLEGKDM